MISFSRSLARQFRAVARRAGLSARHAGYVRLVATPDALSLYAANHRVAVEYRDGGRFIAADLTVPLQLFADCEGKRDNLVTIRLGEPGHVVATWDEGGLPQHRDYLFADDASIPSLPPLPTEFASNEPDLLIALRDVMETTEKNATRYALGCIQLKGRGSMAATDSHQMLMQSGFVFGWSEDVLMEASDVFASRELPRDQPVQIGKTANWVTVQVGAWTIHHAIQKEGRFPDVERVIPAASTVVTRMQLDADDAEFLSERIERLPADDTPERPVTVDLNGSVAIRARQDDTSPLTELVLSRSRRIGPELRVQTNREFLARALDLGFTEFGFMSTEAPCVCTDATRTYAWQMLDPQSALAASGEVQRIASPAASMSVRNTLSDRRATNRSQPVSSKEQRMPMSNGSTGPVNRLPPSSGAATIPVTTSFSPPAPASNDLIVQAERLRDTLRTTLQDVTSLIVAARQQRRQSRLMKTTLASLKQLQQLGA